MSTPKLYGIIDETCLGLHWPRVIDHGPYTSLNEALAEVKEQLENYPSEVNLVIRPARWSDNHECYLEDWTTHAQIKIEACEDWAALFEEDEAA